MLTFNSSLYLIADGTLAADRSLKVVIEEAARGGITIAQLCGDKLSTREFYELATNMKTWLKPYNIPLIINNRLDIALACNTEGLHLDRNGIPYSVARKYLGENRIIGMSVETTQEASAANSLDLDYIGIGPIFETSVESEMPIKTLGLNGLKQICQTSKHTCIAFGGINAENGKDAVMAGVDGIAVSSAILAAEKPTDMARMLKSMVDKTKKQMEYGIE